MIVKQLKQTCVASPSQWEGKDEHNRPVYVHYRWGWLSICVGQPGESIDAAVCGTEVFGRQIGDDLDRYLRYDELKKSTVGEIEWP